ncbi:isocitrate lyase/PEP mutase family protein [Actinoplanes regularis]|uniref:isocitrate lyase/PEP mutase family protein n=1 Tax=Actinoplanes regularis TaxID=52697 RepID=UPI0024A4523C|nr:isocitrate lyase/PEP mutase family protein [Actinoplanes regularis]GLW33220.1 2-methylisocitrate lyase [Actinoplanes regularis]
MTASALRALLASGRVTHVPGVYDPVTAALAVAAGHKAVHLSGAAVSATMLGRPDLGFVHATQIADRASTLVPGLRGVPLLADADTGYGNPLHAVWTGLAYSRAGISGLHLEDQVSPKRCGHLAGKEVIDTGLAAAKIKALAEQVPQLAVIARTDAYAVNGLADTIERCVAYAEAGADAVFPEGVQEIGELAALHKALPGVPLVVNRSEAAANPPAWTDADLSQVGVRLVLHPVAALLAAMRAASVTYRAIAESGSADQVERMPWAAFTALVGQDEALDLDARYVPSRLQT